VLRLPRKVTMDTSEVLRLPRKLQFILRKRRKSIAPAARHKNDFHPIDQVRQFPAEKVIPYLRQK